MHTAGHSLSITKSASMKIERRRHPRYEGADLAVDVARPGIKGILEVHPNSECLNFSLGGLRFGSNQQFQEGEPLIVDLRVHEIEIAELHAQVVACTPHDGGMYCTGVRFCFEDKNMQRPEVSRALLQIEDKLRVAQEFPA